MMAQTDGGSFAKTLLIIILLIIVVVAGVWLYNAHNRPTAGQQIGKAIDAIPPAVSSATADLTDSSAYSTAGEAASSAVSKTGAAASSAVSETSADIKAAVNKQKQQNASRSSSSAY